MRTPESFEDEKERQIELLQKEIQGERIRRMNYENQAGESSAFGTTKESNMAESQLDLTEELNRIYHLLSGHVLITYGDGTEDWEEPRDDRLKIFSDYGVKQIMNIISFYLNKNTLLSYYDMETINWKVRDFGVELSDLIHNRYEVFFSYPTPEELFEEYYPIVKRKGLAFSEGELYSKCVQWSSEEMKSKLRHFPMIILALVDSVHSTYLRALGGKERESYRKHIHVSENSSQNQFPVQPSKKSLTNPKTW